MFYNKSRRNIKNKQIIIKYIKIPYVKHLSEKLINFSKFYSFKVTKKKSEI